MNIFEQYGGYGAVKQAIANYKKSGDMVTAAGLELQCLEYRRKHNIFEVGDLVVDTTGFFDWLCRVEYLSTDGRVVMYKHDQRKGDTAFTTWPPIETVRHATDEEIKEGRRL